MREIREIRVLIWLCKNYIKCMWGGRNKLCVKTLLTSSCYMSLSITKLIERASTTTSMAMPPMMVILS